MDLSSVNRTPNVRPVGVESPLPGRVAVAHVALAANPPPTTTEPTGVAPAREQQVQPGVVNLVKQADKASVGEGVYTSVSDPTRRGSEAATASKDWTIHRPAPEKVEDPPPVPLYKMLMDHLKAMWTASAVAVQVQQVKNQQELQPPPVNSNQPDKVLPNEVLTYSPSRVHRSDKTTS